jgi:hypothetical protein
MTTPDGSSIILSLEYIFMPFFLFLVSFLLTFRTVNDLHFCSLVLFQVHGDLVIKPSETSLTRDQFKSFVASCNAQSNSRVIGWRSPQQRDIPENEHDR